MNKTPIYNSKNIFAILGAFVIIFSLLHYLAVTLHQTQKINAEIDNIRAENKKLYEEIVTKKRKLAYLKTPQRIDKDAKTQIGKRQKNERSITFIKKETPLSVVQQELQPTTKINNLIETNYPDTKNYIEDWYKLLWKNEVSLTTLTKTQELP